MHIECVDTVVVIIILLLLSFEIQMKERLQIIIYVMN